MCPHNTNENFVEQHQSMKNVTFVKKAGAKFGIKSDKKDQLDSGDSFFSQPGRRDASIH